MQHRTPGRCSQRMWMRPCRRGSVWLVQVGLPVRLPVRRCTQGCPCSVWRHRRRCCCHDSGVSGQPIPVGGARGLRLLPAAAVRGQRRSRGGSVAPGRAACPAASAGTEPRPAAAWIGTALGPAAASQPAGPTAACCAQPPASHRHCPRACRSGRARGAFCSGSQRQRQRQPQPASQEQRRQGQGRKGPSNRPGTCRGTCSGARTPGPDGTPEGGHQGPSPHDGTCPPAVQEAAAEASDKAGGLHRPCGGQGVDAPREATGACARAGPPSGA